MVGLNKMMVIGNLGTDPEMRYTPSGNPVTSFRIATTRTYTSSDGERQQDTEWFTVVAWNQLAELCNQYLSKGRRAYVDGRLHTNSWEGPDGQTPLSQRDHRRPRSVLGPSAYRPVRRGRSGRASDRSG